MHIPLILMTIMAITGSLCESEGVLEFTDNDFEARMAEYPTALVLFYDPWCSYCQHLQPEFAKAAKYLIRNDPPVVLIQLDCTAAATKTCDKYSISSYPKLKIFQYGEFIRNYDGTREAEDILKYMKAEAKPPLKDLKSIFDLEMMLNTSRKSAIIGFFNTKSKLNDVFLRTVWKFHINCQFAFSSDRKVLEHQGFNDAVVLYRPIYLKNKFESVAVRYLGSANTSELNDFIITNFYGLVGVRTLKNRADFKLPLIAVYFEIDYDKNHKRSTYWRNRVLVIAKEFKGKVSFAISSSKELVKELNSVGIEVLKSDKPAAVATDIAGRKSVLKEEFSVEALRTFAANLLSGKLEIYVRSEPIPETNQGPVMIAVANNFESVVLNNGKDTIINLYAPWCERSKKLDPIYEELAESLNEEDISIVKMDASANDIPASYKVSEYPTVYWAPKNKKDTPFKFKGEGSVFGFIKFIAQRATNELKGWDRSGNPKYDRSEF